jgi:hypothetical protein
MRSRRLGDEGRGSISQIAYLNEDEMPKVPGEKS